MTLNQAQRQLLMDALVSGFSLGELRLLLEYRLGVANHETVFLPRDTLDTAIADTIGYFEHRGMIDELIVAAHEFRPRNGSLAELASAAMVGMLDPVDARLERVLSTNVPYFEPMKFHADGEALQPRVCRIEMRTTNGYAVSGTGFLVGADRVMTAGHVMQPAVDFAAQRSADVMADPRDVVFLFDFKRLRDGRTPSAGVEFHLKRDDWQVAYSPESPGEFESGPKPDPDREHLDFAVVRLDSAAGNLPIGTSNAGAGGDPRGWVDLPNTPPALVADSPLLILHHPGREPLKLSIETRSIIGLNANETRLRHRTNTNGGSSGAPCFDAGWNLVGVHQGTQVAQGNDYNQCVPIAAIAAAMRAGAR